MTQLIKLEQPNCRPCSEVSKFLANNGVAYITYDVTEKPEVAAEYGVMSVPVTILLDDQGKEIKRSIGCNYGELEELIAQL
ncbi:thioredoxin family protein [Priestia aryabhattai]|uniref:thioredoxin family protein n=1 Tax=Priestia aryabhattai TaxID=412384 RepID=UPI003531E09B